MQKERFSTKIIMGTLCLALALLVTCGEGSNNPTGEPPDGLDEGETPTNPAGEQSEEPGDCKHGLIWDGQACVAEEPACDTADCGQSPDDPDPAACEDGFVFDGQACVSIDIPDSCDGIECPEGAFCREAICVSDCEQTVCGGGEACWMDGTRPFCKRALDMDTPAGTPHPMEGKTLVIPDILFGGRFIHPPNGEAAMSSITRTYGQLAVPLTMFQLHDFDTETRTSGCTLAFARYNWENKLFLWHIAPLEIADFSYDSNPRFEIRMTEQYFELNYVDFYVRVHNLHVIGSTDADDPTRAQVSATGRLELDTIEDYIRNDLGVNLDLCLLFKGCNAERTIQINLDAIEAYWDDIDVYELP